MSKVVSIKGYEIQYHNGEPMVQDLELAERLGYSEPRMIRKLIKRLLERESLQPNQVCVTVSQTSDQGGRPATVYYLGEFAALKVTTQAETDKADAITNEIIQVFIDARNGNTPRRADPVALPYKQAEAVIRSSLSICKMLGTEPAMAKVIAVKQASDVTGVDFGGYLPADNAVEDKPLSPTELGKKLGMSGQKVNKALAEAGLQEKTAEGDWMPTEKGRAYATVNPYQARNSSHTGYRVLWREAVVSTIFDSQR